MHQTQKVLEVPMRKNANRTDPECQVAVDSIKGRSSCRARQAIRLPIWLPICRYVDVPKGRECGSEQSYLTDRVPETIVRKTHCLGEIERRDSVEEAGNLLTLERQIAIWPLYTRVAGRPDSQPPQAGLCFWARPTARPVIWAGRAFKAAVRLRNWSCGIP